MFVAGCGNFNSGTPQQMFTALLVKIGGLPDETLVYVGHEYTVSNLQFALQAEPGNAQVAAKLDWALAQRARKAATVPSTLGEERACNPFVRACLGVPAILAYSQEREPVAALAAVRRLKTEWGRRK